MEIDDIFRPIDRADWRNWLMENHKLKQSVWIIYAKKKANSERLTWRDAVDEALCFGWIDSTSRPMDEDQYMQLFSRRKHKSNWSKINKLKVEELIQQDLMTEMGYESIKIAIQNGSWTILDEVEELIIPSDLEAAFLTHPQLKDVYLRLSNSVQKSFLYRLVQAKKNETRQKRITEIIAFLADKR